MGDRHRRMCVDVCEDGSTGNERGRKQHLFLGRSVVNGA